MSEQRREACRRDALPAQPTEDVLLTPASRLHRSSLGAARQALFDVYQRLAESDSIRKIGCEPARSGIVLFQPVGH